MTTIFYKRMIGERCYLSPISTEDAESWTTWLNDLEVTIGIGNEAFTPAPLEKIKEKISQEVSNQRYYFNIVEIQNDKAVGRCYLFDINSIDRVGKLCIFIGDKQYWDRGIGTEAVKLLLDYGFNLLNLNNIMLGVYSFNERAYHCYQKIGFKEIGRRRQAKIFGNQKFDLILMDILAEEFESIYVKKILDKI